MYKNKIVIGIDQSYSDTGISVAYNGKIKVITNVYLKPYKSNTERRRALYKRLNDIFNNVKVKAALIGNCSVVCIIERIRLQSSQPGREHFLNFNYIKGIGALNALIVDLAAFYNIKVYSVDTRSWKSQVVGSSKRLENSYGVDPEKWRTIKFIINAGLCEKIKEKAGKQKKKGVFTSKNGEKYTYNDNKADSACIALYGFIPEERQKLILEY